MTVPVQEPALITGSENPLNSLIGVVDLSLEGVELSLGMNESLHVKCHRTLIRQLNIAHIHMLVPHTT